MRSTTMDKNLNIVTVCTIRCPGANPEWAKDAQAHVRLSYGQW